MLCDLVDNQVWLVAYRERVHASKYEKENAVNLFKFSGTSGHAIVSTVNLHPICRATSLVNMQNPNIKTNLLKRQINGLLLV